MAITMDGIFVNGQKATFRPEDILSGDASAYTEEIGTAVEAWLEENVTGGEQVTDTTLTLPGVPADAKETGDQISAVKEDLSYIAEYPNLFNADSARDGYRLKTDGTNYVDEAYFVSSYIPVTAGVKYVKNSPLLDAYHRLCTYNSDKTFIRNVEDSNAVTITSEEAYIRFCGLITEKDTTILYSRTDMSAIDKTARAGILGMQERFNQFDYVEAIAGALAIYGDTLLRPKILIHGDLNGGTGYPYTPTMMYRLYTEPFIMFPYDVRLTCPSTYYFRVYYYAAGEFEQVTGWSRNYVVPANQQFRIVIRQYPEDSSVVADEDTFAAAITFTRIDYLDGVGSSFYNGEQIRLAPDMQKQHRCDMQQWKSFQNTDDAWKMYNAQALEILNGNMFIFTSSSVVDVVDMESKEVVSTFLMPEELHYNTVQFSNLYFDGNDAYPLLFAGTGYNTCNIYRIVDDGSQFTATLINTINVPFVNYGAYVSLDNDAKTMYIASYTKGEYAVYVDNPIEIYSAKFPNITDIKSVTPIDLTDSDVIARTEINHTTMQDIKANNGVVYMANTNENETTPRQFVWAVNMIKNELQTIVRMAVNLEVEGLAIDNGVMYVSQRRGANSGNDNPLMIYSIEF